MLVLGNEYAVSWGVLTHALALPGQLARELATRTGFGADVDVATQPGMSITDVLHSLPGQELDSYDAVLVLTGVGDAFRLLSPLQWMTHVRQLTANLTEATAPGTQLTIVGIQPVSSVNITHTKEKGRLQVS